MTIKRHQKKISMDRPHRINILGTGVDDISEEKAVDFILELARDKKRSHLVVTVNAEFVMLAKRNKEFSRILQGADLALADGWWVAFSRLILGGKEQQRVTGVDLIEKLAQKCAENAVGMGFLGGFGDVAKTVAERQKSKYKKLNVIFAGPGDSTIGSDLRLKLPELINKRIDILMVAYGMGRQEFWIDWARKYLDVGVFIGVGGAFDYLAKVKKRAPKPMQNLGLEWLWRLAQEPARIWRMRVLPVFLAMIMAKIVTAKKRPLV